MGMQWARPMATLTVYQENFGGGVCNSMDRKKLTAYLATL